MLNPIPTVTPDEAEKLGYDCGRHGASDENCHFSIFSSPDNTNRWNYGNARGKEHRRDDELTDELEANAGSVR